MAPQEEDMNEENMNAVLEDLQLNGDEEESSEPSDTATAQNRAITQLMRKIPVTLTLEVGSARVTLQDLLQLNVDSVIDLDTAAGAPLVFKVNGTPIGRAEVVVVGENYGLKVVELADLDLNNLNP
ncbi:MAG: FliM/FliN family flagellar motor switch protein [Gammaproteobacteria bacterium]